MISIKDIVCRLDYKCPCHTPHQEEPWVAEFDALFGGGDDSGDYPTKAIKALIRKTLEADRKEKAGVVVERIDVMKVDIAADTKVERMWQRGFNAALEEVTEIIKDVMK